MLGHLHEIFAGLQKLLGKGAREYRVGIVIVIGKAIERGLAGTCRKHRKHAFRQLRHRRKAATTGHRPRARPLERIVAAGIEHQDRGARLLVLQTLDDAIGEHGSVTHQFFLAFGGCRHVDRQQEILPRNFKAMAGVKEKRSIARLNCMIEGEQRFAESLSRLVFRHHDGEAELLERLAHGAGIVDRLLQLRHVFIIVIADDQRHALGRLCRRDDRGRERKRQRRHRKSQPHQPPHRDPAPVENAVVS
jgi:hypothetical protein